jgi:hypothetical protein
MLNLLKQGGFFMDKKTKASQGYLEEQKRKKAIKLLESWKRSLKEDGNSDEKK